jgi:hypothetical protein
VSLQFGRQSFNRQLRRFVKNILHCRVILDDRPPARTVKIEAEKLAPWMRVHPTKPIHVKTQHDQMCLDVTQHVHALAREYFHLG